MRTAYPLLLLALVAGGALVAAITFNGNRAPTTADNSGLPTTLGGKPQGHVYTSATEEPADVNPLTTSGAVARSMILRVTHDTLLDRDPESGEVRPALAVNHQLSGDGRSCTFKIRKGVRFSDGAPLTMADILFGWELAAAGHLPLGFISTAFANVEDATAIDDHTLRLRFRERHFATVETTATAWLVPQRTFFVERVRRKLAPGERMPDVSTPRFAELLDQIDAETGPGTGPFVLENDEHGTSNWRRRQELLLTRHERSWRRTARPGTWNFAAMRILFRDQGGARNALLQGEIDWSSDPEIDRLLETHAHVREQYKKRVYDFPQLGVYRITWNCRRAPCDDARVRRALSMLLDREQIVRVLGGDAHPAAAHAKIRSPSYPSTPPPEFDPSAARRLLREAGFDPADGRPLRLSLLALTGSAPLRRIADLFTDAAKQAGIQLDLRALPFSGFIAERKREDWDGMLVLQWFDATGDPYRFLHSRGSRNDGGWQNEEADRLAETARTELDEERRNELWRRLHEIAHEQQPATLIVHPLASVLLDQRLEDFEPGTNGVHPERAWVSPSLQRR